VETKQYRLIIKKGFDERLDQTSRGDIFEVIEANSRVVILERVYHEPDPAPQRALATDANILSINVQDSIGLTDEIR